MCFLAGMWGHKTTLSTEQHGGVIKTNLFSRALRSARSGLQAAESMRALQQGCHRGPQPRFASGRVTSPAGREDAPPACPASREPALSRHLVSLPSRALHGAKPRGLPIPKITVTAPGQGLGVHPTGLSRGRWRGGGGGGRRGQGTLAESQPVHVPAGRPPLLAAGGQSGFQASLRPQKIDAALGEAAALAGPEAPCPDRFPASRGTGGPCHRALQRRQGSV